MKQDENTQSLTYGQKAVSITFNSRNNPEIDRCNQLFADCIDQMNNFRSNTESKEAARLASIAITELQGAQMFTIKALTWKD